MNDVGRRRRLDRLLRRLGPTWRASPLRRVIQVVSLVLFCVLFFYVAWPYADVFTATVLSDKEWLPAELFLLLDPLLALSTAVAARAAGVALLWAAGVFLASALVPRGFCGYLCPLGALIDAFDRLVGGRVGRFKVRRRGWWVHLRYYLLGGLLASSASGVLLAGYFSAIPLLNRGLVLGLGSLQLGFMKNWDAVGPMGWTSYFALASLAAVLLLGLLGRRFWCRCVCPTGALFSVFSLLRLTGRKVEASCIKCGKCAGICPFDAIKADFTARGPDCAFCRTCGGVCPTRSIRFTKRWDTADLKPENDPPTDERPMSRRAFFASAAGGVVAATAVRFGPRGEPALLRPPGSVAEVQFLRLCIRCGECVKVCPGPVLRPAGVEGGLEALWTPVAVPSRAGCHHDCNFCTQVCPTGAIRPLTVARKRRTAMGLAEVNARTCLPHAGEEDCRLCFETCRAAGYNAIAMREIELEIGEIPEGLFSELEIEAMSHIEAPFVDAEACVGCGQCENRCHTVNVVRNAKLKASAIAVVPEKERRLL